jgi:hypothetical protein
VKPCVHHTFCHAKSLAAVLDHKLLLDEKQELATLPRSFEYGLKAFPEIDTWLVSHGMWRATVTGYDSMYYPSKLPTMFHPTGGIISMLWHEKMGPVFAGSMPEYILVEPNNMQSDPNGRDDVLTPRIECWEHGKWFTQLYDLNAKIEAKPAGSGSIFAIHSELLNSAQERPDSGQVSCFTTLKLDGERIQFDFRVHADAPCDAVFVFPVVASIYDPMQVVSDEQVWVKKEGGRLLVTCKHSRIQSAEPERIFNLIPGFSAYHLKVPLGRGNADGVSLVMEFVADA